MDQITLAYQPSTFEGGRVLVVPANYGTHGSMAHWDWTPTYVPPVTTVITPNAPLANTLGPGAFNLRVFSPEDTAALIQSGYNPQQVSDPAAWIPPGIAGLKG